MIQISNNGHKRERGFTLMELLIVMSIMIILMLIAIPNFISMRGEANETSAMQSLRAIYQAQIQYQTNFPSQRLRLLAGRTRRQHERRSAEPAGGAVPAGRSGRGTEIRLYVQHRQLHQSHRQQPGHVHLV